MSSSRPGFRAFALAVYEQDGVSAAALQLQNGCDVDVNVVLLAAYVGAVRGCAFGAEDLADAQRRVGAWQRDVVRPLRAVRSGLKLGPPPAPDGATEDLRQRIKALELDAEMIELQELAALADQRRFSPSPGDGADLASAAMRVVTSDDGLDAIAVIATAAVRFEESS